MRAFVRLSFRMTGFVMITLIRVLVLILRLMYLLLRTTYRIIRWIFRRIVFDLIPWISRNLPRERHPRDPVPRVPPYGPYTPGTGLRHCRVYRVPSDVPRIGGADARRVGVRPHGPGRGRRTHDMEPRSGDRSERKRGP